MQKNILLYKIIGLRYNNIICRNIFLKKNTRLVTE